MILQKYQNLTQARGAKLFGARKAYTRVNPLTTMNWNKLQDEAQLDLIRQESAQQPVLIFKHSTRCSISAAALARMERNWNESVGIKPYYLDLISYRSVSNQVAEAFGVEHQSPQVLLIQNGECVYDTSHMGISFDELKAQVVSA